MFFLGQKRGARAESKVGVRLPIKRVYHLTQGCLEDMWEVLSNCETGKLLLSARFTPLPSATKVRIQEQCCGSVSF